MKKLEWNDMTLEQKLQYLDDCAEKARERFKRQWNENLITILNEKVSSGNRLSVEEFESYTGIKFSHNMVGKMKEILSLSTCCLLNPLCRNRLEKKIGICAECFAESIMFAKTEVAENTCYNYQVLSEIELPDEIIPYIDRPELRLESFGDVGTVIQAKNYIKMALFNKHCAVSVWTKNPWIYEIAFRELGITICPGNLTIILSSQFLNKEVTIPARFAWFIKKNFTVYTAEYLFANNIPACFINCGGRKCKSCQKCYVNAPISEVNIREILKKDLSKMEKAGYTWQDSIIEKKTENKKTNVDFSGLFH